MELEIVFFAGRSTGVARSGYSDLFGEMGINVYQGQNFRELSVSENTERTLVILMLADPRFAQDCNKLKSMYPEALIGMVDFRGLAHLANLPANFDFGIVNSIEKELDFNSTFPDVESAILIEFPKIPELVGFEKGKKDANDLIVTYHGNLIHLNGAYNFFEGLSFLGYELEREVTVKLVYDIKSLGIWSFFGDKFPNVKLDHIQWSRDNLSKAIMDCDFGICPSLSPYKSFWDTGILSKNSFLTSKDDYLVRFKVASNMARALIFFQFGKPIIAELNPSSVIAVGDNGERGALVHSSHSVAKAGKVILSMEKEYYTHRCRQFFESYLPEAQLPNLVNVITRCVKEKSLQRKTTIRLAQKGFPWTYVFRHEIKVYFGKIMRKIFIWRKI